MLKSFCSLCSFLIYKAMQGDRSQRVWILLQALHTCHSRNDWQGGLHTSLLASRQTQHHLYRSISPLNILIKQTLICSFHHSVNRLSEEASLAKKTDGDMYQRKNKLINKMQQMYNSINTHVTNLGRYGRQLSWTCWSSFHLSFHGQPTERSRV